MANVAWIGIEQTAPQPDRSSRADGTGGVGEPGGMVGPEGGRRNVRRHERPVLGPFDLASTVFQRHAREVVLGSAVFIVPAVVINLIVSNVVFSRFDSFDEVVVSVPEFIGGIEAATGAETLLAFVAIVINSLAVALAGGFLAGLVVRRSLGLDVGVGSVLRAMARRLPALGVAWLLGHSWMVLGSLALVQIPSDALVGLGVIMVPVLAWIVSLTLLVSPVIVVERLGPIAGLRRGVSLARRRIGIAFGMVALCAVIGGGLRLLIGMLPQLIESTGLVTFGRFASTAEGVASQLSQLLIVPLVGLATAQCYLQMRMDVEGMDLMIEADSVFPR